MYLISPLIIIVHFQLQLGFKNRKEFLSTKWSIAPLDKETEWYRVISNAIVEIARSQVEFTQPSLYFSGKV